jgi:hypothetical protein
MAQVILCPRRIRKNLSLLILHETPIDITSRQSRIFISTVCLPLTINRRRQLHKRSFAAGVNNTAADDIVEYFSAVVNDTDNIPCVANIFEKLKKNSKGFKQEKLIHEKTRPHDTVPVRHLAFWDDLTNE